MARVIGSMVPTAAVSSQLPALHTTNAGLSGPKLRVASGKQVAVKLDGWGDSAKGSFQPSGGGAFGTAIPLMWNDPGGLSPFVTALAGLLLAFAWRKS